MAAVLTLAQLDPGILAGLLGRYGLALRVLPDAAPITASFWGEPEAGIEGTRVYGRADTPVHSILHETAHVVCMSPARRASLFRDAGGNDLEESAVCYLQVLLAQHLPGVGAARLMQDMDAWGYSFRLGSTRRWFEQDARDARNWLIEKGLISDTGEVTFALR